MEKKDKKVKPKYINFPEDLKERLEVMSVETNLTVTTLINLAAQSLIANYEMKGSFIFADLLNPEHKEKK